MAQAAAGGGAYDAWDNDALIEAYVKELLYTLPHLIIQLLSFSLKNALRFHRWLPWLSWFDSGLLIVRRVVRAWLYKRVESDLWIVIGIRRWRMQLPPAARLTIDLLARITEFSVSIPFFISVIPALYLCGYTSEAGVLLTGLSILALLTSGLKDNFCSPRPSQHPAILQQLNKPEDAALLQEFLSIKAEPDYSCPSLHSACSLFFGLCVTSLILAYQQRDKMEAEQELLTMLPAILWCVWVSFTRLWLGVHSLVDLSLGALVGLSAFYSWRLTATLQLSLLFPNENNALLDQIRSAGWSVEAYSLLYAGTGLVNHYLSCVFYPRPIHRTESFEHTTTFLGAWGGFYISRVLLGPFLGVKSKKGNPGASSIYYKDWAAGSIFQPYLVPRIVLGLLVSSLVRVVAKQELTPWITWILDRVGPARRFLAPPVSHSPLPTFFPPPDSPEDLRQQMQETNEAAAATSTKDPPDVDAIRRYLNYALLTLSVLVYHEYF